MPTPVLSGSLTHFTLPHLLRLLQSTRATGRLEIERNDERTELFIEDGKSMFARTTGATMRIGDILVRRGELRPEAIDFALAVQQDRPEARLGRMLVDNGVLTQDQINEAVLAVQRHIVVSALRWRMGTFRFGPGERLSGEDIRLPLDVDELLIRALGEIDGMNDRPDDARVA